MIQLAQDREKREFLGRKFNIIMGDKCNPHVQKNKSKPHMSFQGNIGRANNGQIVWKIRRRFGRNFNSRNSSRSVL